MIVQSSETTPTQTSPPNSNVYNRTIAERLVI